MVGRLASADAALPWACVGFDSIAQSNVIKIKMRYLWLISGNNPITIISKRQNRPRVETIS